MKPLIVLIVNTGYWSTGEIGKQIIRQFHHKYDFLFMPESVFTRRRDMLHEALVRADLVFCLNETGATLLQECARATLPPVISWIHHVTTWSEHHETAARLSNLIVACTPSWRHRIASHARGAPIAVVRHGVDLTFFTQRPVSRKKFGIADDAFVVGFFGARGSDMDGGRKGIDVLLAVLRRVSPAIPGLHVVFVGPGWDSLGTELRAAGALASIFGFVPRHRLPWMYSLLDAYLITARVEGGPMTVLESMACGTPVVSTRVGLVPDVIADGENGFTAEPGDVNALAVALLTMAADRTQVRSMRAGARTTVERYAWETMLAPCESIFDHFIKQPSNRERYSEPSWINDPDRALRVNCAAECLVTILPDIRYRRTPWSRGLRMLKDMLTGVTFADCCRALAMLRGR